LCPQGEGTARGLIPTVKLFARKHDPAADIEDIRRAGKLPAHIAIIMDGNGRWAKKRGLPRNAGHARGSENFDRIATVCSDMGIRYLTVYAFSTENWKRDKAEVDGIFDLFRKYLKKSCDEMVERNVKLRIFGDTSPFPEDIIALIDRAAELSEQTTGMVYHVEQAMEKLFCAEQALQAGTMFPELYKPMNCADDPATNCPSKQQEKAFALWEMRLYLNTHPCDKKVLHLYRQLAKELCDPNYASTFDEDDCDADSWNWVSNPWPWECRFQRDKN